MALPPRRIFATTLPRLRVPLIALRFVRPTPSGPGTEDQRRHTKPGASSATSPPTACGSISPRKPGQRSIALSSEANSSVPAARAGRPLGDPLVDLGLLLCYWSQKGDSEARRETISAVTTQAGWLSRAEIVESLQASGATIFRVANFDAIEDIQQNIRLIAQAIGEEARGDALVAQMNSELAAVRARIPVQSAPPRVLLFSLSGNTAGAKTSFDAIVRAAGAVNVVAEKGMTGFPQISAEQIVEWQPDVIVIGAEAAKASDATARLYEHPVVATTAAARNRRIIALDNRYLLSVSQHITHAIAELAAKLYGETTQTKAAAK